MTRRLRRNHSPAFKPKMALAAIRGEKTLAELAEQYDLAPGSRTRLLFDYAELAGAGSRWDGGQGSDVDRLSAPSQIRLIINISLSF